MLISIYMPTFNRLELLKRAIESVKQQTYKNIELIIVNDNSNDGTYEYLNSIQSDRLKVIHNTTNKGACECRNIAISVAKGEYLTGLDDDDYFHTSRIESFVNAASSSLDSNIVGFFDDSIIIKRTGTQVKTKRNSKVYVTDLYKENKIGNQLFIKKSLIQCHLFDPAFPLWQDWDAWLTLIKKHPLTSYYKNIHMGSYYVDLTHDHERITDKSLVRVEKAFDLFLSKHSDVIMNKKRVRVSLINYDNYIMRVKDYLLLLIFFKYRILFRKIILAISK
ncbi:glycosyltransferase family 2 protein [Vibrio breoganii]|uniref:glycosyltransferase family 2 protein n=1 Tax=Vibrio breoganii TaxID=553239 RepID=UPI0002D646F8|nr:glycosyltransferase [Vibrio breoganii]OED96324.1 hypothetical protein A1QG_13565 [Vibrio breoganii ZF-29]TKG21075.1 glycosyltransferase [Vibrio breoganii]